MEFPTLQTQRLILREIKLQDASDIFTIFSDPEVVRFHDLEVFQQAEEAERLIHSFAARFEKDTGIRWGITWQGSNQIVGTCGCGWRPHNHSASLGYELATRFWGQGIATEALQAVIGYAFSVQGINRLEALTYPENLASAKVLQKLNFHEEGVLRQYGFWKGQFHDLRCFSLLKHEMQTS